MGRLSLASEARRLDAYVQMARAKQVIAAE
jgi:hypothetical protein